MKGSPIGQQGVTWAELLDSPGRVDEVQGVRVVLLDAGRDGEDVRVENDVHGVEADNVNQETIGTHTDADLQGQRAAASRGCEEKHNHASHSHLVFLRRGLASLVKGHDNHSRTVLLHNPRLSDELLLAALERDGVHDALALAALQAGLNDRKLGGVDHEGDLEQRYEQNKGLGAHAHTCARAHLGDLRFRHSNAKEFCHRGDAINHAVIDINVNDLSTVFHLLASHCHRLHANGHVRDEEVTQAGRQARP